MKVCPKCGESKPQESFHKDKNRKDGLSCWCKVCACKNSKRWAKENPDKVLSQKRKYNKENRLRINKYNDEIRKKYPDRHCARQKLRYFRKNRASPPWLSQEQKADISSIYTLAKKFEFVFGLKYHVDHIIPIKGEFVCGLHVPWNLQILEEKLNIKKSNKMEW